MGDSEQSGFRPALKSLLESHQQLSQQMVSKEQQRPLLIGNGWPCSGAHPTCSDFPTTSRLSGEWEVFSSPASGGAEASPGFLGETPAGFVVLWGQLRLGGAGGVCLSFGTDSPSGHWTVGALVEICRENKCLEICPYY